MEKTEPETYSEILNQVDALRRDVEATGGSDTLAYTKLNEAYEALEGARTQKMKGEKRATYVGVLNQIDALRVAEATGDTFTFALLNEAAKALVVAKDTI